MNPITHHRWLVLLLLLAAPLTTSAQYSAAVEQQLKTKYTMVQYRKECQGWYLIGKQHNGETRYGFADTKGNVVVADAYKYRAYRGFVEFYQMDQTQKEEYDRWLEQMKEYQRTYALYQEKLIAYERLNQNYANKLAAFEASKQSAHAEAERRWKIARERAIKEAEAAQPQQSNTSGSFLAAALSAVASGVSAGLAANKIQFEPYYEQVLGERGLTSPPAKPYNPLPSEPSVPTEPSEGYYWGRYPLRQPSPYDKIDYDKITGTTGFANVIKGGLYGLVDVNLKEIYPCQYQKPMLQSEYSEDTYLIAKNNNYGLIDQNAKEIVPFDYSDIEKIGDNLLVKYKELYGVVDYHSKQILPYNFTTIEWDGERYKVCRNNKYGLYAKSGEMILPCEYTTIQASHGYLLCERDELWGIYSQAYEELYPCQFQGLKIHPIGETLHLYTQQRGLWGVTDFESGVELLPNNFSNIEEYSLNNTPYYRVGHNNHYGLYRCDGVLILPCHYDSYKQQIIDKESYIEVTQEGTVGLYNLNGVCVIETGNYDKYAPRSDHFYDVYVGNKRGVCSPTGAPLIPCKYEQLTFYPELNGFLATYIEGEQRYCGVVDLLGNEVFPFVQSDQIAYDKEHPDYFTLYTANESRRYGAMDFEGTVIVPTKYKERSIASKVRSYAKKHDIATLRSDRVARAQLAFEEAFNTVKSDQLKAESFSFFAQNYVECQVNEWQKKGEFEKLSQWQNRVNEESRQQKVYALTKEAQELYIEEHSKELAADRPEIVGMYDPDNETYRIKSSYAKEEILVQVPVAEAQEFKTRFDQLEREAQFFVSNDHLALADYSFKMPSGEVYNYNNHLTLNHVVASVDYNFDRVEIDNSSTSGNNATGKQTISTKSFYYGSSDVDVRIPLTDKVNKNCFVVIIANENYENEKRVEFAYNDGQALKEYCTKALGVPESNLHFRANASINQIKFEVNWMRSVAKAYNGEAEFIFYYAGHGMPDDATKEAYLLPVDAYSADISTGYKLGELYKTLGEMPAKRVLVLLDACFSGAARDGETLASARGVAIKPKITAPSGNMVVFSAATDVQTAYPYREKSHGLFTYFLLKEIQQSATDELRLGTLVDGVSANVAKSAIVTNNKAQTPTLSSSPQMGSSWREILVK